MRKNIDKVITAFKQYRAAKGDSKATCHTDGMKIYSYHMLIAHRVNGVVYIITDVAAPSATTKSQIRAVQTSCSEYHADEGRWEPKYLEVHSFTENPEMAERLAGQAMDRAGRLRKSMKQDRENARAVRYLKMYNNGLQYQQVMSESEAA